MFANVPIDSLLDDFRGFRGRQNCYFHLEYQCMVAGLGSNFSSTVRGGLIDQQRSDISVVV